MLLVAVNLLKIKRSVYIILNKSSIDANYAEMPQKELRELKKNNNYFMTFS